MKKIIEYFKNLKVSTICKLVLIVLLGSIIFWNYKNFKSESNLLNNQSKVILKGNTTNKEEDKKEEVIKDNEKQEEVIVNDSKEENNTKDNEEITPSNNDNRRSADDEVIEYLNTTESYFSDVNYKEEVKKRFIIIVDFLFYNGKIKGHTLSELSNKTKLQVFKIMLSIDKKIEDYIPGYKESIKNTSGKIYTSVKSKVVEQYLKLTTKICDNDKELCKNATRDFQEMKKSFSIGWSMIKDLVGTGTNNLKKWYEIFSGKTA